MPDLLPDLIPARILNEHVYCPRLAYLEWVDRQFVDNADTADGTFVHRVVDRERAKPPDPPDSSDAQADDGEPPPPSNSVTISSERLGMIAKIDLLEARDGMVVPVEYKRGSPRAADLPLWEPELVQLCAQVLILRDSGYHVPHAETYFAQTRTRHRIEITDALIAQTTAAIEQLRTDAAGDEPPPPLVDSPKCPRCSLVGICLPDEVNALRDQAQRPTRRLVAGDPPATPLYATSPGSRLTKRGGRAVLLEDGKETASRRLIDISHIAVLGNVTVGSALLRACFDSGLPILWFTAGGWFSGFATGMPAKNVAVRMRQHRAAALGSPELALPSLRARSATHGRCCGGMAATDPVVSSPSSPTSQRQQKVSAASSRCSASREPRRGCTSPASARCSSPSAITSRSTNATAVHRATRSTPCSRSYTPCSSRT